MGFFYVAPGWFFGIDIFLELLFGLVTGLVAFFSYKVYKFCEQKECRLLSVSFGFISASYFTWAILNLFFIDELRRKGEAISFSALKLLPIAGVYLHMLLFLIGLGFLVYLTFNVKNDRIMALIASLSIIGVIFSSNGFLAFNFISALLLFYIALFYFKRFINGKGFAMFLAFTLLFIARIDLVFSVLHNLPYVVSHIFEFVAYLIMIVSLIRVIRK